MRFFKEVVISYVEIILQVDKSQNEEDVRPLSLYDLQEKTIFKTHVYCITFLTFLNFSFFVTAQNVHLCHSTNKKANIFHCKGFVALNYTGLGVPYYSIIR